MPWVVPLLPALITAGTTGTEIGLQASGALSPGGGPSTAQLQQQQQEAAQKQQQTQLQEAFKSFAPAAQAQTGGALSDTSLSALINELSGNQGTIGGAQQTIFGTTPGLSSSDMGGS